MATSNFNTVANDFVIPAGKTLKIDKIIPHLIRSSFGATVSFYKDNNGQPGELIVNYANPTIESQTIIGNTDGGSAYETVIKLPQILELTEGKYWVAINAQGPLISWETKSALSNGTTAFTTTNGQNWVPKTGYDGVFKVSYICETEEPEVVLVEGMETGSAFPEGNTVVVHNLVYKGIVIDTCIFNVNVNKILNTTEVSKDKISIYPNPVKDFLNITNIADITNVNIYDMSGKQVFAKELHSKKVDLDLSKMSSGIYILKVKSGKDIKAFKLIKK